MLFSRAVNITVGKPGAGGKEITGLRTTFNIEKDLTNESNKGQINLYNLSPDTLKLVEKPDTVILLDAGYKDSIGRIFEGAITFVSSKGETDVETSIEAADGHLQMKDSIFSKSYKSGIGTQAILHDIARSMGIAVQVASEIKHKQYQNGYAYAGLSNTALGRVCSYIGAKWSIQNGIIQIRKAGGAMSPKAFLVSTETGMIGVPERIVKSQSKTDSSEKKDDKKKKEKEKKMGWKVKSLLNPAIDPGSVIQIQSKYIQGFFRVESIKHTGDTHGNDWYTEMEVFE